MKEEGTHAKKDVRYIHTHIYGVANERQVDEIAPSVKPHEWLMVLKQGIDVPNEPESDKVVGNEFGIVLAWFFETEKKDNELLAPVSRMQEVVSFQVRNHIPVRIVYKQEVVRIQKRGRNDTRDLARSGQSCTSKLAIET